MDIIRAEQIVKAFNGIFCLGPLDLRVARGEVLEVIGPQGAGKTTLLKLLWGFMQPDHGRISIFGMQPHLDQTRLRRRAGYFAQNTQVLSEFTARQFLRFTGHYYEGWEEPYAYRLLHQVDIDLDMKLQMMTKGDKVKLGVVAAVAHHPALLILDEPTSGVESPARLEILRFLRRLANETRMSIVAASLPFEDLNSIADSVLMLKDGRAVEYTRSTILF